jgi:trehalose 6-phosphate synthase/phosphatase
VITEAAPEFILAAGDDTTDEELFRALPRNAVTICVGGMHSFAAFRLADHVELRELLRRLTTAA